MAGCQYSHMDGNGKFLTVLGVVPGAFVPEEPSYAEEGEEEGEPSESEMEQNWSEEDAQAMEQWLRRIPNDPGGLLRRKFRYQYQRMGRDQDGNNLWPDDEVQPW